MTFDMASLLKLQEQTNAPINLNIKMDVDEKTLADAMIKKMDLPVPNLNLEERKTPVRMAPSPVPQPKPLRAEKEESSSESESESSSEEEEEEKFHAVQRYTKQKPLMLRPE